MPGRNFDTTSPLGQMMLRRGMSRTQLATAAHVSPRTITYLSRGDQLPTPEVLARLAVTLRCRPVDLLAPDALTRVDL